MQRNTTKHNLYEIKWVYYRSSYMLYIIWVHRKRIEMRNYDQIIHLSKSVDIESLKKKKIHDNKYVINSHKCINI